MLVYLTVVVLAGASDFEKMLVVGTVLGSHLVLMVENCRTRTLIMNGRTVAVSSKPDGVKTYERRLDMARELVHEMGRSDFAVRLGMINPEQAEGLVAGAKEMSGVGNEVVTM